MNIVKNYKNPFIALMDIGGKLFSSEDLSNFFVKQMNDGSKAIIFIIGGSYGVNPEVKDRANIKISFGKNTWPHNLMKVMLMEQIFRAETIIENRTSVSKKAVPQRACSRE